MVIVPTLSDCARIWRTVIVCAGQTPRRELAGHHVIGGAREAGELDAKRAMREGAELGAERLVDLATLTGAIVTTFGKTYAGLIGNDDGWCGDVAAAGERTGEIVWRLPLHDEYAKAIEGKYADIANAVETRQAGSIAAAEFLKRFVGEVPWAHLDIAGTAWDLGRAYAAKGGSGWGVRLLVELARANSGAPDLH